MALAQYRSGARGEYELSDMKGTKMPEIFVSNDNIDELWAKLSEFENNNEIYEKFDHSSEAYVEGGTVYRGKYDIKIQQQHQRVEKGEITEAEFEAILVKASKVPYAIKKEYLPDYFKLYQPVSLYDNELLNLDTLSWKPKTPRTITLVRITQCRLKRLKVSWKTALPSAMTTDGKTYFLHFQLKAVFNLPL